MSGRLPSSSAVHGVRGWAARWDLLAFWLPLLVVAAVVLAWPPHTVDGPAHLLGARVLGSAIFDSPEVAVFSEYYRIDLSPTPNLGSTVLLAALVELVGMRTAESVLLVTCAVGLPVALRYAIRALRPQAGWLGLGALPFGFGYLYFYGFYGYCLGLVLFLFCVGLGLRTAPTWAPLRTAAVGAGLTLTWFTHLVPFALAVAALGVLALSSPGRRRALPAVLLAAAPGLALTAHYLLATEQGAGPRWAGTIGLPLGLVSLHTALVALSRVENLVAVGLAAALAATVASARRGRVRVPEEHRDALRAVALAGAASGALYLAAPADLGIDFGLINERLSLFPVLLGLLWLGARPLPARAAIAVVLSSTLATAALFAVRVPELRRVDGLAQEYARAQRLLEPGGTLLALRFTRFTPDAGRNFHADPIRHLSSLLAARVGAVDVGHYEAVLDYFPTQFRDRRDLRRAIDADLTGLGAVPPRVDLERADALGLPIGQVLLVGTVGRLDPDAAAALAQVRDRLRARYERVGATAPRGLVEVWRLRRG